MELKPNEIHVWSTELCITPEQEETQFLMLNKDEQDRAIRFRFPVHKRRFIAARHALRQILSLYLQTPPQDIQFGFSEHSKPHILLPTPVQFNLSHSEDMAVFAITLNYQVGIDIEKIQSRYNSEVAKRFFSPTENQQLMSLPEQEQSPTFYRIWARKEALIKAIGKGLSIPLPSFSVATTDTAETLTLENDQWSLIPITIATDYASALACNQVIKQIITYHYPNHE